MTTLIEEKDVTVVNLALALEQAVIEYELGENGSIYVLEDYWFPFMIDIQKSLGYVTFSTSTNFRKNTNYLQRLELCNELNSKNYLVTAVLREDQLLLHSILNYRDGMLRETFIRACRQFSGSLLKGLDQVDPDYKLFMPPGQEEQKDEQET